jgi:histone H3/H4
VEELLFVYIVPQTRLNVNMTRGELVTADTPKKRSRRGQRRQLTKTKIRVRKLQEKSHKKYTIPFCAVRRLMYHHLRNQGVDHPKVSRLAVETMRAVVQEKIINHLRDGLAVMQCAERNRLNVEHLQTAGKISKCMPTGM